MAVACAVFVRGPDPSGTAAGGAKGSGEGVLYWQLLQTGAPHIRTAHTFYGYQCHLSNWVAGTRRLMPQYAFVPLPKEFS